MKQIKSGIIGFGLSGRYFFSPFLTAHPQYVLKTIVTSQKDEVKKIYPETTICATAQDLFEDTEIDLVVVASPNFTHFEYAKKALLSGKHVIVEKPFTVTSQEVEELIILSNQHKKLLAPFQNRRWDGDFLTVKKLVNDKSLGEIIEFESHFDRYRPDMERVAWKNDPHPGVGTLYDLGPHLIDQALFLFGKPDYVYGDIRRHRQQGMNDDNFEIQLHYPETKVILKAGVMVREIGPRFIVHGRKGSFIKYGLDVQEQNLKNGILPGNRLLGKDLAKNYGLLNTEIDGEVVRKHVKTEDGHYMGYFDNIIRAIFEEEELIVKPEDGKLIIEVIEKALQSSKEKRLLPF